MKLRSKDLHQSFFFSFMNTCHYSCLKYISGTCWLDLLFDDVIDDGVVTWPKFNILVAIMTWYHLTYKYGLFFRWILSTIVLVGRHIILSRLAATWKVTHNNMKLRISVLFFSVPSALLNKFTTQPVALSLRRNLSF